MPACRSCGAVPPVAMHLVLSQNILWCRYVGEKDLEFFKERVEQPGEVKGAGPWEHMMYKDFGSFTYEAWRRSLTVCTLLHPFSCWHSAGAHIAPTCPLLHAQKEQRAHTPYTTHGSCVMQSLAWESCVTACPPSISNASCVV